MVQRPQRPHGPPRFKTTPSPAEGEPPSLAALEEFSEVSLRQWLAVAKALNQLHTALFFGLELERQQRTPELLDAIRTNLVQGEAFECWSRIVDYGYGLEPLSVAGSLKGDGGRFNIGAGLNAALFAAFPALYLAEDYPTAFREKFSAPPPLVDDPKKLDMPTQALRAPDSFTHVSLRGRIELLLDISKIESLQAFAAVLRTFAMPARVRLLARQIRMRAPPGLIRSAHTLQRQLLSPVWRMFPVQFDLPSNSQVFGRIAAAAGAHAVRYPSAKQGGTQCLVLFPQNWRGSSSFVEVVGAVPPGARYTRIDGTTVILA